MELNSAQLGAACLVVVASALLQGSVGFGFSILAAPLLILINPMLVPGPLLVPSLVQILMIAIRDRRSVDLSGVKWALAGMVPGTFAGALILATLPAGQLKLIFGGLVLTAVAMSLLGLPLSPNVPTLSGAGFLSGIMSSVSTISGPPVALVYQHASGTNLRGTLAVYFLGVTTFSIIALSGVGHFSWQHFFWALPLVPAAIFGVWASGFTIHILDRGYIRPAILALSAIAAVIVIISTLI
jgi:uncharacterized membrane protein YfcA